MGRSSELIDRYKPIIKSIVESLIKRFNLDRDLENKMIVVGMQTILSCVEKGVSDFGESIVNAMLEAVELGTGCESKTEVFGLLPEDTKSNILNFTFNEASNDPISYELILSQVLELVRIDNPDLYTKILIKILGIESQFNELGLSTPIKAKQ